MSYNDELNYQQDNHPVHKSKKIQNYISENNIKVIDWPSNSPDINPIENLWSIIKFKLTRITLTSENFEENIIKVINDIDFSVIYNMISNMHLREKLLTILEM